MKKLSHIKRFVFFVALGYCGLTYAGVRVGFLPTIGNSTYPLVIDGVRQVVLSDLAQTGEFDPVFELISNPNPNQVDVVLQLSVKDSLDRAEVTVRATDAATGYNIGSQKVVGNFQNVKLFQDKISSAALSVLRSGVVAAKQTEISKSHIHEISALNSVGEAGVLAEKKDYLSAMKNFSKAQSQAPDSKVPQYLLERTGKSFLAQAKAPDDRGLAYMYMNNSTQSMQELDQALKSNPKNQKALLGKANLLISMGQNQAAEAVLLQAQKQDPQNPEIPYLLGKAAFNSGNKDFANEQFKKSSDLGSTNPEVYESLGNVYAQKRQLNSASASFSKAAELSMASVNLRDAKALYAKANQAAPTYDVAEKEAEMLIRMGQIDLAITVLNKLIIQRPDSDAYRVKLGYAFYIMGQYDNAMKRLKEGYEINSKNYEANLYLGIIFSDYFKDLNQGIKHLENACKIKPDEAEAGLRLAQIYLKDKKSSSAISLLEKMTKVSPKNVDLQVKLGDAYFANENYSNAELSYNRAIQIFPESLEAHEGLAKTYIKQGQGSKAVAEIDKVYAIDATDNVFVREGLDLLGEMTSKELIELSHRFPKYVDVEGRQVPINQVLLVRLKEKISFDKKIKEYFSIYVVNESKLRKELELALFSRYRILPAGKGVPSELLNDDFTTKAAMDELSQKAKVEGIFGYDILKINRGPTTDQVTVNLMLHSSLDGALQGVDDTTTIAPAIYPSGQIIVLNRKAPLAYLITVFLLLGPVLYFKVYRARKRGWGTVRIIVNYDPKLESFLTLKLSTKEEDIKSNQQLIVRDKEKAQKKKYKEFVRQKGTWVKQMVGRNAIFERVPARTYYCYLYGTIEDSAITKKTVGNYAMVQKFTLRKNEDKELTFELEKKEAYVKVFVMNGEQFLSGNEIQCSALSETKFARGEAGAFLYLPVGEHTMSVKHEGKVFKQKVSIRDLNDKNVYFDVQNVEDVEVSPQNEEKVVKAAENLEKQGRLKDASALYEKAGKTDHAAEAKAQQYLSEGDSRKAAEEYARAKDFIKAAEVYRQMNDLQRANVMYGFHHLSKKEYQSAVKFLEKTDSYQALANAYKMLDQEDAYHSTMARFYLSKNQKIEAAQSYIKAKEYSRAAEIYEGLGEASKAAVLYAKDGNYSLAANLYAQSGENEKAAASFEQGGFYDEAILIYKELEEKEKVIQLLDKIERYTEAAKEAKNQGLNDEAIKICQKVQETHVEYVASQILLAELFYERGVNDLALSTFAKLMRDHSDLLEDDSLYTYGDLLENSGQLEPALTVFEKILQRNFHFKDVSIRVSELKSKVSNAPKSAVNVQTISGAPPKESRYEILGELGRGAMGIVFKAKDKMLDRLVAYKTLPHTLKNDTEALESLMREAQTAAKLNHPNIVTIYDVGEENDSYYIAMEYVEGKTLQDILKQYKKANVDNFLHIAKSLCSVVYYAHEQRVIHRDIKPSNIILMQNKNVKLMDFGLAKILQDLAIDKTMLRGTPLYMSPEQILGKDIDHRCDIYSLGIVFYEMLSGSPPFTQGDIMYAHLHSTPKPLSEVAPQVPKPIADAVMKCLNKDKTKRPENGKALWMLLSAPAT